MTIAELLRREIAKADTLMEVSEGADVSYGNLYRFYYEETDIRLSNVQRLVDYFGFQLVKKRPKQRR